MQLITDIDCAWKEGTCLSGAHVIHQACFREDAVSEMARCALIAVKWGFNLTSALLAI